MELIIQNPKYADAVVCAQWCITEKDRKAIVDKKILSAHMLIIVSRKTENNYYKGDETAYSEPQTPIYNYREVARYFVPVKIGAVYHSFDHPGMFKISATIVGSADESVERLRSRYVGECKRDVIHPNGDFDPQWPFMGKSEIEVNVAEEFFAPPPSEKENWYMELWPLFRKRPVDQCNWRRRRLFAYTLMPFALLAWWLIRVGGGLLVYLAGITQGRRGMIFRAVYDEKNYDFKTIYRSTSFWRSVFWKDVNGKDRLWGAFLHPWLIGTLMLIARGTFGRWATWGQFFGRFIALYLTIFVVITTLVVVWMLYEALYDAWRERHPLPSDEEQEQIRQKQQRTELTELDTALQELSCQVVKGDTRPKLRTITLKYHWLKAQVCRPYRKG